MKGTIICNEHIVPIHSIRFTRGQITIEGTMHTPRGGDYDFRGELRVHGEDGAPMWTLPAKGNHLGVYTTQDGGAVHITLNTNPGTPRWA